MPRVPHTSPQTLLLFEALVADPARWRYGYDLSKQTALASGTLYPILMRLSQQELLETRWEPSDEPGRPPRHIYRLSPDGLALAEQRLAARSAARPVNPIVPRRTAGGLDEHPGAGGPPRGARGARHSGAGAPGPRRRLG